MKALDSSLPQKAFKKVKSLARGNGVSEKEIVMSGFEGALYEFETLMEIHPKPYLAQKKIVGRETKGQIVSSPDQIRQAAEKLQESLLKKNNVRNHLVHSFNQRQDKGYGISGKDLRLDEQTHHLVAHEKCSACGGKANSHCSRCHGSGKQTCTKCHGRRVETCPSCSGRGRSRDSSGQETSCRRCGGRGNQSCSSCGQTGQVSCHTCNGRGQTKCAPCKATGYFSHVATLEIHAEANLKVQKNDLPEWMEKTVQALGNKLAAHKHAAVLLLEDGGPDRHISGKNRGEDVINLKYKVQLPAGTINIRIGKKLLKTKFFGYQCKLMETPNFLDTMVREGFQELRKSLDGKAPPVRAIRKAAGYRLIREMLILVSKYGHSKAETAFRKRYPFGVSKQFIHALENACEAILKILTKRPRQIGMGLSIFLAAVFFSLYFLAGLRSNILSFLNFPLLNIAVDALVLVIAVLSVKPIADTLSENTLRRSLNGVLPKNQIKLIKAKQGKLGLAAKMAVFILFFFFCEMTRHSGAFIPAWYAALF